MKNRLNKYQTKNLETNTVQISTDDIKPVNVTLHPVPKYQKMKEILDFLYTYTMNINTLMSGRLKERKLILEKIIQNNLKSMFFTLEALCNWIECTQVFVCRTK